MNRRHVRQGKAPAGERCTMPECWRWKQHAGYCRQHGRELGVYTKTTREEDTDRIARRAIATRDAGREEPVDVADPRKALHTVIIDGVEYEAWTL